MIFTHINSSKKAKKISNKAIKAYYLEYQSSYKKGVVLFKLKENYRQDTSYLCNLYSLKGHVTKKR